MEFFQIRYSHTDNFKMEIIDEFDDEKTAYEKEKEWISFYKSTDHETGMNLSSGGEGMPRSAITEETMNKWRKVYPGHCTPPLTGENDWIPLGCSVSSSC